ARHACDAGSRARSCERFVAVRRRAVRGGGRVGARGPRCEGRGLRRPLSEPFVECADHAGTRGCTLLSSPIESVRRIERMPTVDVARLAVTRGRVDVLEVAQLDDGARVGEYDGDESLMLIRLARWARRGMRA